MLSDPEFSPQLPDTPAAEAGELEASQPAGTAPLPAEPKSEPPPPGWIRSRKPRQIPNIADTLLLLVLASAVLFVTEIATFAIALGTHIFGRESPQTLLRDPRLLVPSMAGSYLIAGAVIWAIFARLWGRPFSLAIRWNAWIVQRRFYVFLGLGILLSVTVQLLSNYLPIPKSLPIDEFFRTPTDVWMIVVFGTFVAPVFEELAFRGFLLPSLASAWDRIAKPATGGVAGVVDDIHSRPEGEAEPAGWLQAGSGDPRWSPGAVVFSSVLTSIGFALLHADQLAHSWTPLSVLFTVSIVLCLVRLRAHSLAASALVHAAYNGTIFTLLFYATDGFRHLDKINH